MSNYISPFSSPFRATFNSPYSPGVGGYATIMGATLAPYVTFTRASTATYFDSAGVMQTAAINAPRYDYDPVTLAYRGLLVEEQRTNFRTNSTTISAGTGTTVTTGASFLDGSATAVTIAKTDATTPQYCSGSTIMTVGVSTVYTASAYAKYDGDTTQISLEFNNTTNWGGIAWKAIFDVAPGGITISSTASCTATATAVGDGWYRITASFTTGGTISTPTNPSVLTRITGGSGTSVVMSGWQLEAGSFATSYIPTTSTSVTRSADVAVVSDLTDIGYNASEGTIYAEASNYYVESPAISINTLIVFSDGTPNEVFRMFRYGLKFGGSVRSGAVTMADLQPNYTVSANQMLKFGIAAQANSANAAVAGTLSTLDTSVTMPAVHRLGVGVWNGHIKTLRYYPRRLSNTELQELTA